MFANSLNKTILKHWICLFFYYILVSSIQLTWIYLHWKRVMHIPFYPVFIPLLVILVIQFLKLMIDWVKNKRFNRQDLFTTWGFPSVHSGMTSSLVTLVYLDQWLGSIMFAMAFVFMFLISYDAMNLRFEAWKHAHYINDLKHDIESVLQRQESKMRLKERMGHTPFEVIGWLLIGCMLTVVFYKFLLVS